MKRDKVFKEGYLVTVVSWENDGDITEYKTIQIPTLELVYKLRDFLAKYMADGCNNVFSYENKVHKCFGNGQNNNDALLDALWDGAGLNVLRSAESVIDEVIGYMREGYITGWRVYDSMRVYNIPQHTVFPVVDL